MGIASVGKRTVRCIFHSAGGLHGLRYWNRNAFRILMYHNFPSDVPGFREALVKQLGYVKRYYEIVSMDDIARHLREGSSLPPNALAVTVDDGNRDFLLNGFPVFHEFKIPVTVYVVTGFLDGRLLLWWDQIAYLLNMSPRPSIQMSLAPGEPPQEFRLETRQDRKEAASTIIKAMKEVNDPTRIELLRDLPRRLDVEFPDEAPAHMAPLTWDDVRELAAQGVQFGAHTVTHPALSKINNRELLVEEIQHSKRRIEEVLGRPVLHFCYPYGYEEHFNEETVKVVEQCQYHTAVTALGGLNGRGADPYRLRRVHADPMTPRFYFRECLAGLHTA